MTHAGTQSYKTTESKYKGGAEEMYVTYDLWQETRGDGRALYPKVKRVYIAGRVKDWHIGTFAKRTGKHVHGVKIEYETEPHGLRAEGLHGHPRQHPIPRGAYAGARGRRTVLQDRRSTARGAQRAVP